MEKEIALGILKTFNRWRRGEDVEPELKPSDIGKAIDIAIDVMENENKKAACKHNYLHIDNHSDRLKCEVCGKEC